MGRPRGSRSQTHKSTVEDSLTLSVSHFRGRLHQAAFGEIKWPLADGTNASVGFRVNCIGRLIITLHYRWGDVEDIQIPVWVQFVGTRFGGPRHWFTCPLVINGVACNRRVAKLHLPPGARYFGCRTCHRLTYRSSQEAHRTERLLAKEAE